MYVFKYVNVNITHIDKYERKEITMSNSAACLRLLLLDIRYYEEGIYKIIEDMVRFKPKSKIELQLALTRYLDPRYNGFNNYTIGPPEIWNTSLITDMSYLFEEATKYIINPDYLNFNINGWDVSKVTNMEGMFAHCIKFNSPLDKWDVSKVTNMKLMFWYCHQFDQNINSWDTSSVTDMDSMFWHCYNFNKPLDNWDVRGITNLQYMFASCHKFNQNINSWEVQDVVNMEYMFFKCNEFNQPLNNWDVSSVTEMASMFQNCYKFNQPLDKWKVGKVQQMEFMFSGCENFDTNLNTWEVSNVQDMKHMFFDCYDFTPSSTDSWNICRRTDTEDMWSGWWTKDEESEYYDYDPMDY